MRHGGNAAGPLTREPERPPALDPAAIRGVVFDLDGTLIDSYAAIAASFETSGFSVVTSSLASTYLSGISRVTKRSRFGGGRLLRTVSMLVSLASRSGITLSAPPGVSTVVKPLTWSTD